MYCTHYSAYIKAISCISLFTEYIIQNYFAHFQFLFSLSLFLFLTWYQSYFLVAFTRQNPVFLRCYGFMVSSLRSQTLSPFLPSSESSSPSLCSTHGQLHWIDLIKIFPLPPESAKSGLARTARSFWFSSHVLPRADQRPHALRHASRVRFSHLPCHVSPSDHHL